MFIAKSGQKLELRPDEDAFFQKTALLSMDILRPRQISTVPFVSGTVLVNWEAFVAVPWA